MKNKMSKIIIFLFIYFLSLNSNASEQFNFDITEIEILENGNKFLGNKRGKITTNNGLTFEADEFEFIKNLNLLNAKGNIIIIDNKNNYKIFTEKVTYKKNEEIIFTKNKSKAISLNDNIEISANDFAYDRAKNVITAEKNVIVEDKLQNYKINSDFISYDINEEIIFTKNKSKAISLNDNIEISANDFAYDRAKNVITAEKNVIVEDKLQNYKINSDFISYDINEEIIFTKGKTTGRIQNKYNFKSSDIVFLKNLMELKSNKKIIIDDNINLFEANTFKYSINNEILKGNNLLINSNYKSIKSDKYYFSNAIINLNSLDFRGKDSEIYFHKNIFGEPNNDPRLKGVSVTKKNKITKMNKGIFTSCKKNDKCPPWAIQAKEIVHDKEKKQMLYKDALVKVFDVPVFYFPKFFHPDPTVDRQSGFLQPKINNSNIFGNTINAPYFHVISENKDLSINPTLTTKKTSILQGEYRQKDEYSSLITDFGFVNNFKSKYSKDKKNIMHLFAKSEVDLNLNNFNESNLEIYLEKTNNDTYLKIFDNYLLNNSVKPKNKSVLSSGIDLSLKNENFNLKAGFSAFEDLNKRQNDRYQYILPYYNFNSILNHNLGTIDFISDGNNVLQNTNNLRTRITNDINFYSNDLVSSNSGFKSNFNLYFKNINTVANKDNVYKSSAQSELMNILEINTSYPLRKNSEFFEQRMIPKLSFRLNPSDMKNYSDLDRKINVNNIFSIDRLALEDSLESGRSLTVGLDYNHLNKKNNNEFTGKLATVYRDKEENTIPTKTSLNAKNSYLYGSLNYNSQNRLNLEYSFATEDGLKEIVYHDLGAKFSMNNFVTNFNFIQENADIGTAHIIENITKFNFDENNLISLKARRNEELDMTEYYDLIYEYKYDCLVAGIKYNKTYYQDRDLEPSEELFFSLTLFPLTKWEQEVNDDIYK